MSNTNKPTNLNIKQFIQNVMEGNFAQADKYLQAAVEQKLTKHMKRAKTKNIFKK
jgi:hypothetical protein